MFSSQESPITQFKNIYWVSENQVWQTLKQTMRVAKGAVDISQSIPASHVLHPTLEPAAFKCVWQNDIPAWDEDEDQEQDLWISTGTPKWIRTTIRSIEPWLVFGDRRPRTACFTLYWFHFACEEEDVMSSIRIRIPWSSLTTRLICK